MHGSKRSPLGVAFVLAVLVIASVSYSVPFARGETTATPTQIDSCTAITEPGRYVLNADIENSTDERCIRIRSSDVIFDGSGHAISGVENESSIAAATAAAIPPLEKIGIAVNASTPLSNVTVQRVAVSDWFFGVYYDNVSTATVRDVTVSNNGVGVYVRNSREVSITNVTPTDNTVSSILVESSPQTVINESSERDSARISVGNVTVSINGTVGNFTTTPAESIDRAPATTRARTATR